MSNTDLLLTYVECLEDVVKSTAHTIAMDELEDINDYIRLIKETLKNQ